MLEHKSRPETTENRLAGNYETVPSHVSSCPTCDGGVVDGQGVLRCVECTWTGVVR